MFKKGTLPPQPGCDLEQTLEVTVLLSLSIPFSWSFSIALFFCTQSPILYGRRSYTSQAKLNGELSDVRKKVISLPRPAGVRLCYAEALPHRRETRA